MSQPSGASPKVLVCCTAAGLPFLKDCLAGYVQLVPAFSMEEATALLDSSFQLVLATLQFDDSRMFDLLRWVHAEFPAIPFVSCAVVESALPPPSLERAGSVATSLGAQDFIDAQRCDASHLRRMVLGNLAHPSAQGRQ